MTPTTTQPGNLSNGNPPKDDPKIITDPSLTAETDELNTDEAVASPKVGLETQEVSTENQEDVGLNTDSDDIGLNHDQEDDLSLNK
jgi:hypothetical protein